MIQPQISIHPALPTDASYPEIIAVRFESETSDWKFRSPILRQLPESFGIRIAGHYAFLVGGFLYELPILNGYIANI